MRINFYFILNNRLKYHFKVFFKVIVYYTKYGYQNKRLHMSGVHSPRTST